MAKIIDIKTKNVIYDHETVVYEKVKSEHEFLSMQELENEGFGKIKDFNGIKVFEWFTMDELASMGHPT